MNKLLFLVLTLIILIVGMYVFDMIAGQYLLTDYYVPLDVSVIEDDISMPLDEYLEYVKNGEDPGIESIDELPWDIKMINFKSMTFRIFIFVVSVLLSIFGGFVLKGNRIDFSLLQLDPTYKKINMVRIAMYVSAVMAMIMTSRKYASAFLIGWLYPVIWLIILGVLIVWTLNIIYAIKENRASKLHSKLKKNLG